MTTYYFYIVTNHTNTTLYAEVTSNLIRRIYEHKNKLMKGFTTQYNITKLVYFEEYTTPLEAINREKQIKGGSREKKLALIRINNPQFKDLYNNIIK